MTQKRGLFTENGIFQLSRRPEFRRQSQNLKKHNQVLSLGESFPGGRQQLAVLNPKRNKLRRRRSAFLKPVSQHERGDGREGSFFRDRDGPFECREFLGDRVLKQGVEPVGSG